MNDESANPNLSAAETIFNAALAFSAAERPGYLAGACANNLPLRQRVEALLRAHEAPSGFLPEQPPLSVPTVKLEAPDARDEGVSQTIGRYKLLEKLGEGGCGVVYVAEQTEPVRRRVALKVIKLGMDTRSVVARFEAERQALAMMDHPNIAKVFDAGATDAGRPFFVMELVKGVPITRYCDENNLSTAIRLGLFVQVCQAIQHAHQKGIIHRDIKPSNVLVADHDGVPVPKVIDFGIAKATNDQRLTDKTLYTAFEQFIGTPVYMSPEQAKLSGLDIDTRSDIYSLGVLLYELLTGSTPFDGNRLLEAGLDEIRRIIRDEEPVRPSTKLHTLEAAEQTTVAKHRQTDPPKLAHLIQGDLDWIVMKALEKDRSRRYETANGLATDIQRHLNNEPVVARPASNFYRFQRMVRRNKVVCTAVGAVALALLAGMGVSTWAFLRERQAHANERRLLYGADMNLGQQAWEQNNIGLLDQLLEETKSFPDRGFEWYYWQRQTHLSLKTLRGNISWINCVAFSSDGQRIVAGSLMGITKVWDAVSGRELLTLKGHTGQIYSVAFSPDGRRIVTGCGYDQTAKVWDAATGQELLTLKAHTGQIFSVAFSPDGRRIVTGSTDQTAKVWDAASGLELLTLKGHASWVVAVAFSTDGRRILTGSYDATAKEWDGVSGELLRTFRDRGVPIYSVAFSPDGQRIVIGNADPTATVWDAANGKKLATLGGHAAEIHSVAFSPDGQRIVTASGDRTIKVWDVASGGELLTLKEHEQGVSSAAFSPDGRQIVSGSYDGTVKVWDAVSDRKPLALKGHTGFILSLGFSPDGQRIVTGTSDGTAKVWDAASGRELLSLHGQSNLMSVAFSPNGEQIVAGSDDHTARVWDAASGREMLSLNGGSNGIHSAAFSPDGRRIVTGGSDGTTTVWDVASGRKLLIFSGSQSGGGNQGFFCVAAFSPDGRRIVTGSVDMTARVWDAASGRILLTLNGHSNVVLAVAFSPDGRRIVTGSGDTTAKVWEAASGRELLTLKGHSDQIGSVAFSPDGQRIVTGSHDHTAKLWDAASGRELLTFSGLNGFVSVAFSPDGRRIVTGGFDGAPKVWEAARKEQVAQWQTEEAGMVQH